MTTGTFRKARLLALLAALTTVPYVVTAESAAPRIWKSCPATYDSFHADLEARRKKLSEKLAPLSDEQVFQFTKSGSLDAKLLQLLWPDLARDPISAAMWSMCLPGWAETEGALQEKNGAHLDDAIEDWTTCQESAYRESLTAPATELVACAKALEKSWPKK